MLEPEINTEPLTVSRWLNWSMFIVSCWSSMTTRLSLDRPTSTTGVFLATETVRSLSWFRTSTRRRQSLLASPTWWGDSLLLSVNHCSGKQCLSNLHIHVSNLKLVSSRAYGIWLWDSGTWRIQRFLCKISCVTLNLKVMVTLITVYI